MDGGKLHSGKLYIQGLSLGSMDSMQFAHTERRSGEETRGVEGATLDLYRITDRFDSKARKLQEKSSLGDSAKRGTSARIDTSNTRIYHEDPSALLNCPTPVLFKSHKLDLTTGAFIRSSIEKKSCDKWKCPVCGELKKSRYVGHFSRFFSSRSRLRFITLTLDPKRGISMKDSRPYIIWAFGCYRKRLNRRGEFQYIAAPEEHKSGYTHLHIICSIPDGVSEEDLRSHWFQIGGGIVFDVQEITDDPARMVGYLMKYVLKDAQAHPDKRNLLASEGIGYYSEKVKEARREYARERARVEGREVFGESDTVWEPLCVGSSREGKSDVPTKEDVKRFRLISQSLRRTTMYVHEHKDGSKSVAYWDEASQRIKVRAVQGDMTRTQITKMIGRIESQQAIP